MSVILQRNTVTARNQLELYLVDNINNPVNAAEISYTLYDMTSGVAVPIYQNADPVNPEVGEYYAAFFIPSNASLGRYRIQWSFRQLIGGPENLIQEEFEVVESVEQRFSITSGLVLDMVRRLRILLRDNNPARNARFRPPTHEGTINEYTRVFGYLWEDEELVEYLERGVDFVNLWPPLTGFNSIESMIQAQPAWRQTILMAAMSHALMALSIHWTSEDFSVAGEELITVTYDGKEVTLPISELFEVIYGPSSES